jgi:hypothetical protein
MLAICPTPSEGTDIVSCARLLIPVLPPLNTRPVMLRPPLIHVTPRACAILAAESETKGLSDGPFLLNNEPRYALDSPTPWAYCMPKLQLRLAWFAVFEMVLFLVGWYRERYVMAFALPIPAVGLFFAAVVWKRRDVLHERLFPGAFEIRRNNGLSLWAIKDSPPSNVAFLESPRVVLAVLGCFTFTAAVPLLQVVVCAAANMHILTSPKFYSRKLRDDSTGWNALVQNSNADSALDFGQYGNLLFPAGFLTLLVLVALTITLPLSTRIRVLNAGLHSLDCDARDLREKVLDDTVVLKRSKRRWMLWALITTALTGAWLVRQLGPVFCRPRRTGPVRFDVRHSMGLTTGPVVVPILALICASSLMMSFGLLLWFGYVRPLEILETCQSRCSALTTHLHQGLEIIRGARFADESLRWERFRSFLVAWLAAKNFLSRHDNQLLVREVSSTLSGVVLVFVTATGQFMQSFVPYNWGMLTQHQNSHIACGDGVTLVGDPILYFLLMIVPTGLVYTLVSGIALLNAETLRQLRALEQFQAEARAAGSDDLYTTVTKTKADCYHDLCKGISVPSLFGLPLNVACSLVVRCAVVLLCTALVCCAGVSLYLFFAPHSE